MIFDQQLNLERYRGLSKAMDTAIDFLQAATLEDLPMGRVEIAGDHIYANHFTYTTAPLTDDLLFEAHRQHLDLHVVMKGREQMALAPIQSLQEVEVREEEDSVLYRGTPANFLTLAQGDCLLVFPNEGHLPKLVSQTPQHVEKLVVKIAL